jgi:hypothetical protein
MSLQFPVMPRSTMLALAMACALVAPSLARGQSLKHGKLSVARAARGTIDLDSGNASFKVKNWALVLAADSNGVNPTDEPFQIAIGDERILLPAGELRASKNDKRFRYTSRDDRGFQQVKLVRMPEGTIRVSFKLVGVNLSGLIIGDPPLCLPFAVIIGDDDGFSGVSFDRPNPYPSRRLTIPGSCQDTTEWPWA